jgi:hypothetical protein
MTNPLLGCDPKEVSPARAGAAFAQFAKQLCADEGVDLTQAWQKAAKLHPDLLARLRENTPAEVPAVANDAPRPAPLAQKQFTALAFQLPSNVDGSVFEAAWRANGNQAIRVDFKKIFLGLVTFIAQKQGVSVAVARRQVQNDYENLARAAGESVD